MPASIVISCSEPVVLTSSTRCLTIPRCTLSWPLSQSTPDHFRAKHSLIRRPKQTQPGKLGGYVMRRAFDGGHLGKRPDDEEHKQHHGEDPANDEPFYYSFEHHFVYFSYSQPQDSPASEQRPKRADDSL